MSWTRKKLSGRTIVCFKSDVYGEPYEHFVTIEFLRATPTKKISNEKEQVVNCWRFQVNPIVATKEVISNCELFRSLKRASWKNVTLPPAEDVPPRLHLKFAAIAHAWFVSRLVRTKLFYRSKRTHLNIWIGKNSFSARLPKLTIYRHHSLSKAMDYHQFAEVQSLVQ